MPKNTLLKLFLCGDVMTGRGIDQVLPYPSSPTLHEPYVKDARDYVKLAERANGPIPKPVSFSYIWGDALQELEGFSPDFRLINLETSVTRSDEYWRGKEIHYRMNPENIGCLTSAKIDYCSLANNHVLDWGYSGLRETLDALKSAKIKASGAGENNEQAQTPATLKIGGIGRLLIFSMGSVTSGVPYDWAASVTKPGVNLLEKTSFEEMKRRIIYEKGSGDIVVVSVHWGANWGYEVPFEQQNLAHRLIRDAGVDLVWGHSSHHLKGIEVYEGKLILYGCGDFLNDYEGIGGYEEFRGDLSLTYFVDMQAMDGRLCALKMIPMRVKQFRISHAPKVDFDWINRILNREGGKFGTSAYFDSSGTLVLNWHQREI